MKAASPLTFPSDDAQMILFTMRAAEMYNNSSIAISYQRTILEEFIFAYGGSTFTCPPNAVFCSGVYRYCHQQKVDEPGVRTCERSQLVIEEWAV